MEDARAWITLNLIPGVSPHQFVRLMARFKTPDAVLGASQSALEEVLGARSEIPERIVNYAQVVDIDRELKLIEKLQVDVITLEDPRYPLRLAEIYEPPILLYARGRLEPADANAVAVVGTRAATTYGKLVAERLGAELAARRITVVSGMAAGIDSAAHRGTLRAGGRTVAVLGCGVDIVYPAHNDKLMDEIIERGCVLSEFPMSTPGFARNFPRRNRIISGLSLGTVVVEAGRNSGALITARRAMEQGREVFAVPGKVDSAKSVGTHALIKDGAKLTETADDIVEEISVHLEFPEIAEPEQPEPSVERETKLEPAGDLDGLSSLEKRVYQILSREPVHIDTIIGSCGTESAETLGALTLLELKGLVRQLPGKQFVRA